LASSSSTSAHKIPNARMRRRMCSCCCCRDRDASLFRSLSVALSLLMLMLIFVVLFWWLSFTAFIYLPFVGLFIIPVQHRHRLKFKPQFILCYFCSLYLLHIPLSYSLSLLPISLTCLTTTTIKFCCWSFLMVDVLSVYFELLLFLLLFIGRTLCGQ